LFCGLFCELEYFSYFDSPIKTFINKSLYNTKNIRLTNEERASKNKVKASKEILNTFTNSEIILTNLTFSSDSRRMLSVA
jgi:hypothetical protein